MDAALSMDLRIKSLVLLEYLLLFFRTRLLRDFLE